MIAERTNISSLPYRNLIKVTDLLVYERSYLSLFENKKGDYFLMYLFDSHQDYDEYLFWKVKLLDLYTFLYRRVSLRDLILLDSKEFVFVINSNCETIENFDYKESYLGINQILIEEIEADWLPNANSYWDYLIPDILISTLEKFASENYIEVLREKSVYFILEPRSGLNSTTVSVADIANFLGLFTRSYLSFIIFDFQSKFPEFQIDNSNYQNSIEELKARLLPRVSDTQYGSFEVGLGVDSLVPIDKGDGKFFEWQKNALESYKNEVFEVDFESMDVTSRIIEKYPLPVRREIFNPIYTISNSQRYTVKTTNRLKTYIDELPPIPKDVKKSITSSEDDLTEFEPEQLEFITATLTVPAGGNISDLNKKALRRNLVAVTRSDTTEVEYEKTFISKGKTFKAITPLPTRRAIKGLIHILICDVFGVEVDSPNDLEIYSKFEHELYTYYLTKVMNNPRSPEAKIFDIYFEVSD